MTKGEELAQRLKSYALRVLRVAGSLPRDVPELWVIRDQMVRSGTAPGAHHREARRGRSTAEFVSKMNTALQELDETDYWLELLIDGGYVAATLLGPLRDETQQLIAIFVASINSANERG